MPVDDPEWTDALEELDIEQDLDGGSDHAWVILFPDDYTQWMKDATGNLALLVDEDQAHELRRLSSEAYDHCQQNNE